MLASCDVALVQGGLTTGMELIAGGRPFVSFPLKRHFEQRIHVRTGSRATATRARLRSRTPRPRASGHGRRGPRWPSPVAYRPIAPGGAARAAERIAELL